MTQDNLDLMFLNTLLFDDNKLVNDLSTLGLRVHTQENVSASDTKQVVIKQYVDVAQILQVDTKGL